MTSRKDWRKKKMNEVENYRNDEFVDILNSLPAKKETV